MSFIGRCRNSRRNITAWRVLFDAHSCFAADFSKAVRLCAVVLTTAALAGCAQSSLSNKSELRAASRQPSLAALRIENHGPFVRSKLDTEKYGLASFYEDTETANGEKFDPQALTAAHRTLPFGTKLRVTNVATGRSVTVRVNDRGPFVQGRIVDVSYSAAERLGLLEQGVAKVRVDVVR
jgi:rare lipoprotein A